MKQFKDLQFSKQHILAERDIHRWNASLDLDHYTISVVYGDGAYGSGPKSDTYEVAVYEDGRDDPIPLQGDDNGPILGWVSGEEISVLMKILQDEPQFGIACRVFHRTRYNRRFSNISDLHST